MLIMGPISELLQSGVKYCILVLHSHNGFPLDCDGLHLRWVIALIALY